MVDLVSQECPAIEVDFSINGDRVCQVIERAVADRPKPEVLVMDNGPEFAGKTLDTRAFQQGIRLQFIQPGKPVQDAFVESFNGRFCEECLNEHWFTTLQEAQAIIKDWRRDYTTMSNRTAR